MIGFNGDDPLDPTAKKSVIDGLTGQPRGLGAAFGRAIARPPAGPSSVFGGAAAAAERGMGQIARDRLGGSATGTASVPGLAPSAPDAPIDAGPAAPPPTVDDVYHRSYSSGSNINNSGKNKFGRFKAALGHDPSDDEIRQFVAANPNEWEESVSPTGEYVFRQKQGFLNDPSNLDSKTGATTIWQNRNFVNAAGSGDGYAPPYEEHQAELPGGGGLDPMIGGNPIPDIEAALGAVQRPGTIQEIIARLQRGG